jgi:hypothetical protein
MSRLKKDDTDTAFLGTGWSFPPTFTRFDNSVVMVSGENDIRESLRILFETELGSRIMVPGYGCNLWPKVFQNATTTFKSELKDYIQTAIINWETRINVDSIVIDENSQLDGVLLITVYYIIRHTNTRGNLVYPFYLGEGTLPPEPV